MKIRIHHECGHTADLCPPGSTLRHPEFLPTWQAAQTIRPCKSCRAKAHDEHQAKASEEARAKREALKEMLRSKEGGGTWHEAFAKAAQECRQIMTDRKRAAVAAKKTESQRNNYDAADAMPPGTTIHLQKLPCGRWQGILNPGRPTEQRGKAQRAPKLVYDLALRLLEAGGTLNPSQSLE